jgi:hypothetical protein
MALNWVSRSDTGFVLLPDESLRLTLTETVILELKPMGQPNPETIVLKGKIRLTSHRLVVLSIEEKPLNDNFSLLYSGVTSFKLEMPWLGSNKFKAVFKVTNGDGGLNYLYQWQLMVSFVEGGAIKFAEHFEQLKTRWDNSQVDELPPYTE